MALLTIVLGLLLAGGGGFFVFLGFDIVMTDRGAAMTIAGTVALSGGIVTLAIGFAILRLSHILRALEQAAKTPPLPARETEAVATAPVAPSTRASLPTAAIVGGGALAAGAAVLATSAQGEPSRDVVAGAVDSVAPEVEPAVADADAADHLVHATPVSAGLEAAEDDAAIMSLVPASEELEPTEGDTAAEIPDGIPKQPEGLLEDDIFADLNEMLHADASVAVSALTDAPPPELADHAGSNAADALDGAAVEPDEYADPQRESDPMMPPDSASHAPDQPSTTAYADLVAASGESGPKVLGSYNAGGRTYTMYSDGSVEAVTENGLERFGSMESLRQHLART